MKKPSIKRLKRFLALAKPYWSSEEKGKARLLLGLLVLLLIADTQFSVYFNQQSGEFSSALAAGDGPRFWRSVHFFFYLLMAAVPVYAYYYYVRDKLGNNWRNWVTHQLVGRYFKNHAFYKLLTNAEVDNPDQRIAEDINSFTKSSLSFLILFAGAILQLAAFGHVLWSISKALVFFLVLYAAVGTAITFGLFGKKMVGLYYNQRKREADFRFGLVRIRENAESIAMYRGERQEELHLLGRFSKVFANFNEIIRVGLRLNLCYYAYNLTTLALPALIIAPRVLSGELEVGRVVEATGAFSAILSALSVFVDNLESLSTFIAGVSRLDVFSRSLKPVALNGHTRIATRNGEKLAFDDVTLQTPKYERTLVKGLTVSVSGGEGLMIVGPSGCGKSSLLRAMAGLWNSGSGTIERPRPEDVMFLPQHAYMILGNLRNQLCYPNLEREVKEEEMLAVLKRVNLPGLIERCGGLEAELDFEKVLSVGERQRLAFARVLLNQPKFILLDEATSALDPKNEASIYKELVATGTTIMSVSHHQSLVRYHTHVLELDGGDGWKVHAAKEFRIADDAV